MAPNATQSLLGTSRAPEVAALAGVGTLALLADLPELCALGGLFIYVVYSGKQAAAPEWWQDLARHRISDSLRSKAPTWFFGALFVASITGMLMPFMIASLSAFSYIVLHDYGKRKHSTAPKLRPNEGMSSTPEWRRHAAEASNRARACTSPTRAQSRGGGSTKAGENAPTGVESPPRIGLDADIQQVVQSGAATKEDNAIASQLVRMARKSIVSVVPEASIRAIPTGNMALIAESGAKPEVDMIVSVETSILADRLKAYFLKGQTRIQKSLDTLHPDVLQKTATKCLSERMTFVRFWRSQFTGPQPMIVLLVPVELGLFRYPIRLNFSVNAPYPLRLATILSKENMCSKELILLVARWARERCISNMSRGQPHSYAWALLVIYYMRHGMATDRLEKSTAELFKGFLKFYGFLLDRTDEPLAVSFTKTIAVDGCCGDLPYIEDPFDVAHHAGAHLTADGVMRMREEFARARAILESECDGKLAKLIERWMPPAEASQAVC